MYRPLVESLRATTVTGVAVIIVANLKVISSAVGANLINSGSKTFTVKKAGWYRIPSLPVGNVKIVRYSGLIS